MSLFINHSVETNNDELIVTLYLDKRFGYEEFSKEFLDEPKKWSLEREVKKYISSHLPHLKGGVVKIMLGTMIITSLPVTSFAAENPVNSQDEIQYVEVEQDSVINEDPNLSNETIPDTPPLPDDPVPAQEGELVEDSNMIVEEEENVEEITEEVVEEEITEEIPEESTEEVTEESFDYTVQSGDTLTKISREFNVPISDIMSANNLTSDMIFVGQKLTIPTANDQETVNQEDIIYKEGMRDPEIINIKKKLNKIGFGNITVTELYGSFTEKKVKEFQEYYGLNPTGNADQSTLNKLNEIANSPHQLNKRDPANLQLKRDLNSLGFGHITVTELYGAFSQKKVKEFQNYYGLKETGIADEVTLNKIEELLTTPLSEGVRRPDVIQLKENLDKIGYGGISLTEYFGSFTEKRVKQFQQDSHLAVTGVADQTTLNKIDEILASPHRLGVRDNENIQLKKDLDTLGFGGISLTNYFGSFSEKRVKQFQEYYNLPVTGVAEQITLQKMEEILSSPHQLGKRDEANIDLKKKLNRIGFGHITVTDYYGSFSKKKVKEFQEFYNLHPSGIADEITLSKLDEVVNTPLAKGMRRPDIIDLKKDLAKVGFGGITLTDYYGGFTEKRVKEFQRKYGLEVTGVADRTTLEAIEKVINGEPLNTEIPTPEEGIEEPIPSPFNRPLSLTDSGEDVKLLQTYLNDTGFFVVSQPTTYYGTLTEQQVKLFQQQNGLTPTGIADARTLQKLVTAREGISENVSSFLITGKGYGHSVGMTQWGAYGMAEAGFKYDEILKYYYTGTGIGNRDTSNQTARVLLTDKPQYSITISSNEPYQVGDREFLPNTETTISYRNGEYVIKNGSNTYERKSNFQISSTNDGLLFFDEKQYEGTFSISNNDGKVDVINHLNVESYLRGVVPYEIIPSWDNSDLFKVQTLAARTYVLKEIQRNHTKDFDVYDTVRSQVYNGVSKDIPSKYVTKIYEAISNTKGEVILYNGVLIDAVYSASAGGHTVDAVDVWGNNVPYLIGKEDPYDSSKYASNWWSISITKQELQELFPEVGKVTNIIVLETKYNRPTKINIIGEDDPVIVSGSEFRNKIGSDKIESATFTIEAIS